ncbi:MAG: hypothetical protein KJ592_04490 [Nanoarchaeota archaeon]|nr:hypothetical protein [Nanoarchaeota archaeon]
MTNSITFICAYNMTRSQISEYLFNKLNKNKKWKAISAGVFGGKYVEDKTLNKVGKKYGFKQKIPKALDRHLLSKQSIIVLVADDIPISLFSVYKKRGIKVLHWKIKDCWKRKSKNKEEAMEEIYLDIEKKIKSFVKQFN